MEIVNGYLLPKRKMVRKKLIIEADTPIRRHVKIKASANPHDPVWKEYFATRKKQMKESIPWWSRAPEGAFVEA